MRLFTKNKKSLDITKKMNIQIEPTIGDFSNSTFFSTQLNDVSDYFAYRNNIYNYDYINNKYIYTSKKYRNNRIKRLNTTEFFRLSILHNHSYITENNSKTLVFHNLIYDAPNDDWDTLSCVLGHIKHYGEKLATKILVNGMVKWIIYDKTAKGGKYYSMTTSIYVNKLKRFMASYNIDFFVYNYKNKTLQFELDDYTGDEECCITYENIKGKMCKTLCGHIFKVSAIKKWLKLSAPQTLCPYCKQDISHKTIESHNNTLTWKEWINDEYVSGLVMGFNA